MPFEAGKYELDKNKDMMLDYLMNKNDIMNSIKDRRIHPILISILRNAISKYPEYSHIKERQPCAGIISLLFLVI